MNENLSDDEIISLEIPIGKPICYELDKDLNASWICISQSY